MHLPSVDPAALAALARASADPALRFAALRSLAGSGDAEGAASLLSPDLPEEAFRETLRRLFADPLLAEAVLPRYAGEDPFLVTAAKLAAGKIDPAAVVARPDRASPLLLPMASRLALAAARPGDAAALETAARADSPDAPFARVALALVLAGEGVFDRALAVAFAHDSPAATALALLSCHEVSGDGRFLALALEEASRGEGFTARAVELFARLLSRMPIEPGAFPDAFADLALSLRFRDGIAGALSDAAAAHRGARLIERADRLTALGLDGAASACLKRLLSTEGRNAEGMLRLSEVQERAGRPEAAIAILAELERQRPGEREISRRLIENLLALGRKDAALARLERLLAEEPEDPATLGRTHALTAERRGEPAARPFAERLLALDPVHPEALRTLARTAGEETAEEAWLSLLRVLPEDEEALAAVRGMRSDEKTRAVTQLTAKANEFAAAGDFSRAERDLRDLLELNPGHLPAYVSLADTLERAGRPADALAALRRGAAADPAMTRPALHRRAGLLAAALGALSDARELLESVRAHDPEDLSSRVELLRVKREAACRGEDAPDLDGELARLDESLAECPDDPGLLLEKGFLLEFFPRFLKRPEHPAGLPLLAAAASGLPERAEPASLHVEALLRAGRAEEALRELSAAEARGLSLHEAAREAAVHFAECGESEAAAIWCRRAAERDPSDPLVVEGWRLEAAEVGKGGLVRASDHLKTLRRHTELPAELTRLGHAYLCLPEAARMFGDPWPMALDLFKQTLALDERFLPACAGLRDLALKAGAQMPELLPEAERNLRRALERLPAPGSAAPEERAERAGVAAQRRARGFLLACLAELLDAGFGKERKKEATGLYEKSLASHWFEPRVHHLAAGCLRILKDTKRAAFHYTAVIDLTRSRVMKDEAVRALNYLRRSETM